jgi:hypothetical protein
MSAGLVTITMNKTGSNPPNLIALDGLLDPKSGGISWQPSPLSTYLLALVDLDWD